MGLARPVAEPAAVAAWERPTSIGLVTFSCADMRELDAALPKIARLEHEAAGGASWAQRPLDLWTVGELQSAESVAERCAHEPPSFLARLAYPIRTRWTLSSAQRLSLLRSAFHDAVVARIARRKRVAAARYAARRARYRSERRQERIDACLHDTAAGRRYLAAYAVAADLHWIRYYTLQLRVIHTQIVRYGIVSNGDPLAIRSFLLERHGQIVALNADLRRYERAGGPLASALELRRSTLVDPCAARPSAPSLAPLTP